MERDVTVVISTIPRRRNLLARALESVYNQTELAAAIAIAVDTKKEGGATTRSRAMMMATTTWVAHLDDDDEFKPDHLKTCLNAAEVTGADCIVPWFEVRGGTDPFPHNRAIEPDEEGKLRNRDGLFPAFGITNLVKAKAAQSLSFVDHQVHDTHYDRPYWKAFEAAGYTIRMIPEITWVWDHSTGNTSGNPAHW